MRDVAPGRGNAGPVTFSLLLHATVLALCARAEFAAQAEAGIQEPPANIRVSLAMRSAPRAPVNSGQENQTEPLPVVEETSAATAESAAESSPDTAEAATETAPVPVITPEAVRASVGTYFDKRQSTQTTSWVTDCLIEQQVHGTRDCDRLQAPQDHLSASARAGRDVVATAYAGVTRVERYARLTEELEQEKVVMKGLMENGGLPGQMAADRYYLNLEYIRYLNGNASPHGPANQFNCKGTGACVYEYTGFGVKRPEAVADADEFRVVPNVLGSRQ